MIDFKNYDLEKEIEKIKKIRVKDDDIDWYSSRKILHEIYGINPNIDIDAYVYHGVQIPDYELSNAAYNVDCPVLVTRQPQVSYLVNKGVNESKTFASGSLFCRHRRYKEIVQSEEAKGTIVYPSHSAQQVDSDINYQLYIDALNKLPDEFKPINICMYWVDILKGAHEIFLRNGFKVYTAGHANDPEFVDSFYEILKNHKYSTTNTWHGSNILYGVEFNIPTFIYAQDTFNGLVPNERFSETGVTDIESYNDYIAEVKSFFKKHYPVYPDIDPKPESKKIIMEKLGMDYWTPESIVRKVIIDYAKKQKRKKLYKKIKSFIINREIIDNKRKITILGFLKFSYKKKLTTKDIARQTKQIWLDVEAEHFENFKQSDLIKEINENSVCVDCGANVGVITELFASKGATVYSFEPQAQCYYELIKKFKNNSKVKLYKKGVFDRNSTMKLYKFKLHENDELFFSQGSSLYSTNEEIDKNSYEEVELIDIADFIENLDTKIDILKMDIEGAEFCVLEKLISKGLHKKINHILVETHDAEIPELTEIAKRVRKRIEKENIANIDLTWV